MPNDGTVSVKVRLDDKDALKELNSLRTKLEKLNESLNKKTTQRNDILVQIKALQEAIQRSKNEIASLQEKLESTRLAGGNRVAELNREIESIQQRSAEAIANIRKQMEAVSHSGNEVVSALEEQLANYNREAEQTAALFDERIAAANQKIADAKEAEARAQELVVQRQQELADIESTIAKGSTGPDSAQAFVAAVESQDRAKQALKDANAELSKAVKTRKEIVAEQNKEIETQTKLKNAYNATVKAYNDQLLAQKKSAVDTTNSRVSSLNTDITNIQSSADAAIRKIRGDITAAEKDTANQVSVIEKQITATEGQQAKNLETIGKLTNKYNELGNEINDTQQKIQSMNDSIATTEKSIAASSSAMAKLRKASDQAMEAIQKKLHRVRMTIERAFRLWMIRNLLRGLSQLMEYFNNVFKAIPEYSAALGDLKGALLTMIQPIMEKVIPVMILFLDIVTRTVGTIAQLVANIFGMSIEDAKAGAAALYDQAEAYKATGSAAKKAANQVAAFDQLNILTDKQGSGDSTTNNTIKPSFDFGQLTEEELQKLLTIVQAIGAALAAWKIGTAFGLGLAKTAALALGLYATMKFVGEYLKAWDEGITWDNLKKLLGWALLTALALGVAFGAAGAAVALLVLGLGLLALGFHDAFENGLNLYNMLTIVAGLLMAGAGISIMTKSWIPLLIAAILACLVALAYFTGHGDELITGLKDTFGGFLDFIVGVFTGDWDKAMKGLERSGNGMKSTYFTILDSLEDAFITFFDHLNIVTNGVFAPILNLWKKDLQSTVEFWKGSFEDFGLFFNNIFLGKWESAWITLKDMAVVYINRIIDILQNALNAAIDGINSIKIGGKSLFDIGFHFDIPKLNRYKGKIEDAELQKATENATWRETDKKKTDAELAAEKNTEDIASDTGGILGAVQDILSGLKSRNRNATESEVSAPLNLGISDISSISDTISEGSLGVQDVGIENLLSQIKETGISFGSEWGNSLTDIINGAVLPINQEFTLGTDNVSKTITETSTANVDSLMQMGNLLLSAIQNQQLTAYLDGSLVSRALYSPMQITAKNHGSSLVQTSARSRRSVGV